MKQTDLAADLIQSSTHITAFTGAGISVESGIPPFRGKDGLWSKYDPDILNIYTYLTNPEVSWPAINKLFYQFFGEATPNAAHVFLAFLEKNYSLKSVITQNIDNLHTEAGSKNVIEYHGNSRQMVCTHCGERFKASSLNLSDRAPRCPDDGHLLKPDFVFFGEPIPTEAAMQSISEAENADLMILIGTTGEVVPANQIPYLAKRNRCNILEINTEKSLYTETITDLFLQGKAAEICEELQETLAGRLQ